MMRITLLGYLFSALCGLLALLPGSGSPFADAVCTAPRIRKNYDSMNSTERLDYRNAIQLSMDRGYYIKFVEMHMEKMSEMEAHRVCMFTYWHRYFLLGFENMLRSLDPKYECITVPYWDEMQNNARAMTGACTNLEGCAMIARDMGGSTFGTARGLSINGAWVTGDLCVNAAPLNRFCEASSKNGTACARCVPRNNLKLKSFPPSTNFASVYRQLFTSGAFVGTGKAVEEGMHNALHAELGGAMGTFQSPSDPLFWSHHAYVDLLLTVYLRCRVGLGKLSDTQMQNNQYAFVQCPHREDAGFFTPSSTITMRSGELGLFPKQVSQPGQDLYQFFAGIPDKYYRLSDVTQLGVGVNYTYAVSGLVAKMAVQCDASNSTTRRMLRQQQSANRNDPAHVKCSSELDGSPPSGGPAGTTPENRGIILDHVNDDDPDAAKVTAWADDVRKQLRETKRLDNTQTAQQLEKMVCMFHDQCRGGVKDYSDEFKKAFMVSGPPPCKRIVDELKSDATPASERIHLPHWKSLMETYFPCEVPQNPAAYGTAGPNDLDQ